MVSGTGRSKSRRFGGGQFLVCYLSVGIFPLGGDKSQFWWLLGSQMRSSIDGLPIDKCGILSGKGVPWIVVCLQN